MCIRDVKYLGQYNRVIKTPLSYTCIYIHVYVFTYTALCMCIGKYVASMYVPQHKMEGSPYHH